MNALVPTPPEAPRRRDPWEGLDPAALVQLYRERGIPAEVGSWGPQVDLHKTSELAPAGHVLVTYEGKAGETAWKRLLAQHPETAAKTPKWGTPHGGRALLFRQRPDVAAVSCSLSETVSVVAIGCVHLPGAVSSDRLLRWKADGHLATLDPPLVPLWIARATVDEAARAEAKRVLGQAESAVEKSAERQEIASVAVPRVRATAKGFDRGDAVELAEALLEDLRGWAPDAREDAVVYDRSSFWVYNPTAGIYREVDLPEVLRVIASYAGAPVGPKGRPLTLSDGAIKGAAKVASWQVARPGFFDAAPTGIVFSNGFVRARDGQVEILPPSHEHRALHALDVPYEPGRDPIRWLAMLREIFRRTIEPQEGEEDPAGVPRYGREDTDDSISLLQEWAGTTLMGEATSRAVCLVLVGAGNDGKSSVLNVIRSLFPASSVSSIAPQEWGRTFLLAGLSGKRLNVVSELPEREVTDSERFKAVVAGDPLTAERKNQDPFTLVPVAGQIFSCNALPPTRDQSAGFWRRFAVLRCDRSFTEGEAVRDLWRQIVHEELALIAAWAIEGAARAQGQTSYTLPESAVEAKAEWQHDSDQVRQWLAECTVELPKGTPSASEIAAEDLYPAYRAWCTTTGHAPMVRNRLCARLKGLGLEHRTNAARLYRLRLVEAWKVRG